MPAGDILATNYAPNPSGELYVNGVGTSNGSLSSARSTERSWSGGWSWKTVWTGTPSYISQIRPTGFIGLDGPRTVTVKARAVTPLTNSSQPTSFTAIYRNDTAARQIAVIQYSFTEPWKPGEWNTLSATFDIPEGESLGSIYWRLNGSRVQADVAYWDGFQVNDTDEPYFDGDTPSSLGYEYAWTGVPHLSPSVKIARAYIPRDEPVAPGRGWRYLAQRLTGGDCPTDDWLDMNLPLQNVTITDTLSGPQAISGTITPEVARLIQPDGRPLLTKDGSAIYAERDGEIVAGGILDEPSWNGPQTGIDAVGFADYPNGQPWMDPNSYKGVKVDPLDVVRAIWNHLQTQPGGNLRMQVDTKTKVPFTIGSELLVAEFDPQDDPNVGPTAFEVGPVLLRWFDTHDLGSVIDDLANKTPFDYRERHRWVGEEVHHFLDFGYPRLGRRREDLRFVVGENIHVVPNVTADEWATDILALGAGEGRTMLHSMQTRREKFQLRRATTVENKQARKQKDIDAFAKSELAWRNGADIVTEVAVLDHPHAPVADIDVGDEIYIEGRTSAWNHVEQWVRVTSKTISPESGGAASLTVVRSDRLA